MNYDRFDGKRILIWGYGREGKSTEAFLKRSCRPAKVDIFEGKREEIKDEDYDFIIKSPGIVCPEENPKITAQTDIFLEKYSKNVIGVTGTKGKSTTSSMLYHVLGECSGKKTILLGNIGKPCLDYFDEIDDDTIVVFEMSCHQLAHAKKSPHVAVFLNLFEEHLDYYGTLDKYFAAKSHITTNQTADDYFFVGAQVPEIPTKAQKTVISREQAGKYNLQVLGEHNDYNAEFVYQIATKIYGLDKTDVKLSLRGFTGLSHRLQFIGEKDGIKYYDDSISTIPNATIEALKAIPAAYSVIIGGMDRGIDYTALIDFIKGHREFAYICAYESGKRVYEATKGLEGVYYTEDLKTAVELAKQITPKGHACVLSPAAASYGYFKNFEERGDAFKALAGL